jgi:dipeptidyl aminopeptidase/acylaminoacyl peptidase
VLAISLDDWAHDQLWQQSPLTQTHVLTGTSLLQAISFSADPLASRGTTIGIGLSRTAPFRIRLQDQPDRLVVEVDRTTRISAADDQLTQPLGRIALPEQPIFFLQNHDVWRLRDGGAEPVTTTAALETALAVAPDGETIAVCRAPADTDPASLPYAVRASLWIIQVGGNEERLLADVGGCADIEFAPDGKTITFTANTAAAPPGALSIWTVPTIVGDPTPVTPLADEWDRFDSSWLPDGRLIYRARHQSGLSVLFVREENGGEREISARLLTGSRYGGIGSLVVGEDMLAVEALRSNGGGADLVLLRFDGTEVAVERRAFWQRPLAFLPSGLLYLSTNCASNVVQQYTLIRRQPTGTLDELVRGTSTAGLGDAVALGDAMLISRYSEPQPGLRGPQALPADDSPGSLWLVAGDGTARRELHRAPVPVNQIGLSNDESSPGGR